MSKETFGGGTPKTGIEKYWNGDFPWIQSSDLKIDNLNKVIPSKFITQEAINHSAAKAVPANSIAIVTRVGVGKLAFMPYAYSTSQDFLSLSSLNVDSLFGIYSLYKLLQKEINNIQGTSIKGITKSDLLGTNINIPKSINEQNKIGRFMKELDNSIALHQRKLGQLELIKQSLLQKLFPKTGETIPELRFRGFNESWKQRKLGEISKITIGEFVIKTKQDEGSPYPVYNGGTSYTGKYAEYNNEGPKIVISARGANAGFVNHVTGRYWAGNSCYSVGVINEEDFNIGYLYQLIKHNQILFTAYQQAANIPSVSKSDVEKFSIAHPKVVEQKKIGVFFKNIDYTTALHQRKINAYQQLKKSLLAKMFI